MGASQSIHKRIYMDGLTSRKLLSKWFSPSPLLWNAGIELARLGVLRWGDWSNYVDTANDMRGFGTGLPDFYQSNPDPPM